MKESLQNYRYFWPLTHTHTHTLETLNEREGFQNSCILSQDLLLEQGKKLNLSNSDEKGFLRTIENYSMTKAALEPQVIMPL